jgi:hypothetical protein
MTLIIILFVFFSGFFCYLCQAKRGSRRRLDAVIWGTFDPDLDEIWDSRLKSWVIFHETAIICGLYGKLWDQ